MKATVKKWGNSAAVRIPASVTEATHLHLDEDVEVREEKGRIVIEPVRKKTYKLEDLLKGINANVPDAGEIVWINFTPQAAHEQAGHRPALVSVRRPITARRV